ncbi:hypothetical protein L596_008935 [Steinernema carpocapsae]|uniref:Uncharacterized protein n=1 Tax=Steinernema carpocapsae TaxID=34508 RepID=A0A4V6A6J6_STECR|nr:hypothetical protein L596_008935 [Steinernema carpocapsae]
MSKSLFTAVKKRLWVDQQHFSKDEKSQLFSSAFVVLATTVFASSVSSSCECDFFANQLQLDIATTSTVTVTFPDLGCKNPEDVKVAGLQVEKDYGALIKECPK